MYGFLWILDMNVLGITDIFNSILNFYSCLQAHIFPVGPFFKISFRMQIKRVFSKISPNLRSAKLQVQYWKVSWRFWWLVFINLLFRWFEVFKFVKLLKSFEEFEVQRHPHPYHCNATLRRQRTHSKPYRKMGCKYFETLNLKSALALLSKIHSEIQLTRNPET